MRTNVTKAELDVALARGLEKAREIHEHVRRYELAAYEQETAIMARSKQKPAESEGR